MDKLLKNQATSATSEKDNDDDQSDKGTYTVELENPNSEEVEARKMIDKVNNWNRGTMLVFVWYIWLLEIIGESAWNVPMQSVVLNCRVLLGNCKANKKTEMLSDFILLIFWICPDFIGKVRYI